MADFTIRPAGPDTGQIEFMFGDFTKADGSEGEVDPAGTVWTLTPELGNVVVDPVSFNAKVQHSGGAGEATLSARADGDIGVGDAFFTDSVTVEFTAPVGAVAGEITPVGVEGPIG